METILKNMEGETDSMDEILFRNNKFQFIGDDGTLHIEKIKVVGSAYRGGNYLKVCITGRKELNNLLVNKIGFMTLEQHKKLCIFVISSSGSDDILEPGLNPWRH